MGKGDKLKKRYFERGMNAFNLLTGNCNEFYYCPICSRPFSKSAIETKELTLEHIPPKAQGGKGIALTCKDCNNQAGETVDAAVSDRNKVFEIEPLFTQNGEYNGRVMMNFGENDQKALNFDLSVKDSSVRFFLLEKSNPPESSEKIKQFFQELNQTPDLERPTIKFRTRKRYNAWHSKVGDLRTAYLLSFASLGYSYIFHKSLEPVRNQLMRYNEKLIDAFWLHSNSGDTPDTNLYIIDKPFSALSVRLGKISILLPWLDSSDKFYDKLVQEYPNGFHLDFKGSKLPWPKTLEMNLDYYINERNKLI